MITRAQFFGGSALGLVAASLAAPAHAAELHDDGAAALVLATEHGIAAGGNSPVNGKINDLINELAARGGGTIIFPPGIYRVDSSGIELKNQVSIIGLGEATQFQPVGDWKELAGVFRIGSDTENNSEPVFRTGLHNFSIKPGTDPVQHSDPIPNTVGVLFNTYNGEDPGEPDAAHRISGLTLWDLDMGIKLKGKDDQGCQVTNIRGRRFLRTALTVGDLDREGGADNSFQMIDFSSANLARLDAACVEVYSANCSFSQVKTWYSKRSLDFSESLKAGAGFFVRATRNTFSQCDAQDNGGHGFVVALGDNSFTNCIADSNGHADNLSQASHQSDAHGFHLELEAERVQLLGCQSFNRLREAPGQAVGFWVDPDNTSVTLIGSAARNTQAQVSAGKLPESRLLILE